MKHICVKCKTDMHPEKNGVWFVEFASFGMYKLWHCDRWRCHSCGSEILTGFGHKPVSEHYQPNFKSSVEGLRSNPKEEIIFEVV